MKLSWNRSLQCLLPHKANRRAHHLKISPSNSFQSVSSLDFFMELKDGTSRKRWGQASYLFVQCSSSYRPSYSMENLFPRRSKPTGISYWLEWFGHFQATISSHFFLIFPSSLQIYFEGMTSRDHGKFWSQNLGLQVNQDAETRSSWAAWSRPH